MARREVLAQLDDELVERLDEIAHRTQVSRSELIRQAANRTPMGSQTRQDVWDLFDAAALEARFPL